MILNAYWYLSFGRRRQTWVPHFWNPPFFSRDCCVLEVDHVCWNAEAVPSQRMRQGGFNWCCGWLRNPAPPKGCLKPYKYTMLDNGMYTTYQLGCITPIYTYINNGINHLSIGIFQPPTVLCGGEFTKRDISGEWRGVKNITALALRESQHG